MTAEEKAEEKYPSWRTIKSPYKAGYKDKEIYIESNEVKRAAYIQGYEDAKCALANVVGQSEQLVCGRCKKLEFMIDHGLGWKDMENDNKPTN